MYTYHTRMYTGGANSLSLLLCLYYSVFTTTLTIHVCTQGVPIVPLVLDGTSDCLTAGKVSRD